MAVLDTSQFNQLVQQVREALLAGSQGVGEVEVVTSLANLVSLPALRLVGATETVVEAPLELLSAPAIEAAAGAIEATSRAIVATVNAEAAADLADAERRDLAELKKQTVSAGTAASAKGDKAFSGAINAENATLYAMQMASYLQTKIEHAQVVILSGQASQDVLDSLSSLVTDNLLICTHTREEAYAAILQMRGLQIQVAQVIQQGYASLKQAQLSVAASDIATALANKAAQTIAELSERTNRVIVESILQTNVSNQVAIRLDDMAKELLLSQAAADTSSALARDNAQHAQEVTDRTEQAKREALLIIESAKSVIAKAVKVVEDAIFSTAGADSAGGYAMEKAEEAGREAASARAAKMETDIVTAHAKIATQRTIEATETVENLISGIRPDWTVTDKTSSNYISNKPENPLLTAEPTKDTLSYVNRDGHEINFTPGDEVRVYDAENDEYEFYKLYTIAEGLAVWDSIGASLKQNVYLTGANYVSDKVIKQGYL